MPDKEGITHPMTVGVPRSSLTPCRGFVLTNGGGGGAHIAYSNVEKRDT